jgi:hypothetical protein
MAKKHTRAELLEQIRELKAWGNAEAKKVRGLRTQIKNLQAGLDTEREAHGETHVAHSNTLLDLAELKRDAKQSAEEMQAQSRDTTVVLRTLGVGQWGDKADANLQYAVFGDGGGGVLEKRSGVRKAGDIAGLLRGED